MSQTALLVKQKTLSGKRDGVRQVLGKHMAPTIAPGLCEHVAISILPAVHYGCWIRLHNYIPYRNRIVIRQHQERASNSTVCLRS